MDVARSGLILWEENYVQVKIIAQFMLFPSALDLARAFSNRLAD